MFEDDPNLLHWSAQGEPEVVLKPWTARGLLMNRAARTIASIFAGRRPACESLPMMKKGFSFRQKSRGLAPRRAIKVSWKWCFGKTSDGQEEKLLFSVPGPLSKRPGGMIECRDALPCKKKENEAQEVLMQCAPSAAAWVESKLESSTPLIRVPAGRLEPIEDRPVILA